MTARQALVLAALCACGEPVAPVGPGEVRIPKGWSDCFDGRYQSAQGGVPVAFRVTQAMPEFELRALCVTIESGVVAAGDSRDVIPSGLERHLVLVPGNHVFVARAQFVAPHFPGYTFDVRSSHSVDLPADTSLALTVHFYEKEQRPINERPMVQWKEERRSPELSDEGPELGVAHEGGTGD